MYTFSAIIILMFGIISNQLGNENKPVTIFLMLLLFLAPLALVVLLGRELYMSLGLHVFGSGVTSTSSAHRLMRYSNSRFE